jgi:hypothetical protein
MKLLTLTILATLLSTQAYAEHSLKREIHDVAEDIAYEVSGSDASEFNLRQALKLLKDARAKLMQSGGELFCEQTSSSRSVMIELDTGDRISNYAMKTDVCLSLISQTVGNLVCVPTSSSRANVFNFKNKTTIGSYESRIEDCLSVLNNSSEKLVCAPTSSSRSKLMNLKNGGVFGTYETRTEDCNVAVKKASNTMVCAPTSSSRSLLTMIDSARTIGTEMRNDDCFSRVQ